MNLRRIFLIIADLGILLNNSAQTSERYTVTKPGTLVEMLTKEETNEITRLVLQGKLNAIGFRHLWDEFKKLQILDISSASISIYVGKSGTHPDRFYVCPANCIPSYASYRRISDSVFTGKASLTQVIPSNKVRNMEDGAFKGCTSLKICQVCKRTPPNLLLGALADSVTAVSIPLGSSDAYRDGKRWETFAFIEDEPVGVTVRIAAMGSLASELIHADIQPKDMNFLTVEGRTDEADFTLIRSYMPNLVSMDLFRCSATVIPDYTFTQKKCPLNIKLPHGLKSIGQRAFSGCGCLCGTLVLPSGVATTKYGTFMGCDNLRHALATGNEIITLGDNLLGNDKGKLIYRGQ